MAGYGRKVKLRVSYSNDAGFLVRLKTAVEEDTSRPKDWRDKVGGQIRDLIAAFLDAPEPTPVETEKT